MTLATVLAKRLIHKLLAVLRVLCSLPGAAVTDQPSLTFIITIAIIPYSLIAHGAALHGFS